MIRSPHVIIYNMLGRRVLIYFDLLVKISCVLPSFVYPASRFITQPENQTVTEGDAVSFSCSTTPSEELQYSWLHNGAPVLNSSRIYQIGSNLYIDGVQKDKDYGDYVCIVTSISSGARQATPPARLTIVWIQKASVVLLNNTRNQFSLNCNVVGSSIDGLTSVEWFRDGVKLNNSQNVQLHGSRLTITNPTSRDKGLYRCSAANAAGQVLSDEGYAHQRLDDSDSDSGGGFDNPNNNLKSKCLWIVKKSQKQPTNLNRMMNLLCREKRGGPDNGLSALAGVSVTNGMNGRMTVRESESVELPCTYRLPVKYHQSGVQLRWYKDGKIFRHVEFTQSATTTVEPNKEHLVREDTRVTLNRDNGSLLFASAIASDAGQYVCQINADGYRPVASEPGELIVIEQLKFAPQPTSKNLELGSIGKVHCKAQGSPPPQVKWIRDDENLPESISDLNGTLTFKNVSIAHRGNYTCIASNSQGQIRATVAINVVVAPRFSVGPEGPIEASESGEASMHCQATGDPKPTIQWDKDLQYLSENNTDNNRFVFLENGTLEIRDVHIEDEGLYGCTIGNSAGLKRQEVQLIVKPGDVSSTEEPVEGLVITRAVLITITVAFAYIILVVGLMIWCRYRRQARKSRLNEANRDNPESGDACNDGEIEPCLSADINKSNQDKCKAKQSKSKAKPKNINGGNNTRVNTNDAPKSDDTVCSNHSKGSRKSHAYDQLSLPRSAITELIHIGRGEFGDVFVGKIKEEVVRRCGEEERDDQGEKRNGGHGAMSSAAGAASSVEKRRSKTSMDDIVEIKEEEQESGNDDASTTITANKSDEYKLVLVKALNKLKDENACQEFKRQIELFRSISHKGVVRLYGLCREKDPHYMVLEYTDWGDLKQFLLATAGKINTSTNSSQPPPLKIGQILAVAYQIARGMDAMYRARFIHKDLAVRNCVISSDFIVKVSYPALCKDKYSREYFKHRNTLLPIRWMAPECIQEDEYTTKSDIFAFAVVVWELFNKAVKIPFEELSNEEVLQRSQTNKLEWTCADETPESLKKIFLSCWNPNPKERPSFSHLCTALSKAIQKGDNS